MPTHLLRGGVVLYCSDVDLFLNTAFEGGRHAARVAQIDNS